MKCKCGREVLYTVNGACDNCEAPPKPRKRRKNCQTPEDRKQRIRDEKRRYYLRNREAIIAKSTKWNQENPEKKRGYDLKYKERVRAEKVPLPTI